MGEPDSLKWKQQLIKMKLIMIFYFWLNKLYLKDIKEGKPVTN